MGDFLGWIFWTALYLLSLWLIVGNTRKRGR